MNVIVSICILINVYYPTTDSATINIINMGIEKAMEPYAWFGIDYTITDSGGDVDLFPAFDFLTDQNTLGTCTGKYQSNAKLYGIPYIRINNHLNFKYFTYVLRHEMGHFLGLEHSYDYKSVMYSVYHGTNNELSRQDSLILIFNYNTGLYGKM